MSGTSTRNRAVSALRRVGAVEEFNVAPSSSTAAQVRATLANVLTALEHGQSGRNDARDFFAAVEDALREQLAMPGRNQAALEADEIHCALATVFEGKRDLFRRQPAPASYLDKLGLSMQPAAAFRFWLRDEVELPEVMERGHVLDAIRDMNDPMKRRPGITLGRAEVVWLTPYDGKMKDYLEKCTLPIGLIPTWPATRLRETLGLLKREPGEHCFVCVTRQTLGANQVFAPTVFEARGYQRFRHWPLPGKIDPAHVGRTYDLNREERNRAVANPHGVPEVVRRPLSFDQVQRFLYVGEIDGADDMEFGVRGWSARLEADREFADEVSGGRGGRELAELLELQV